MPLSGLFLQGLCQAESFQFDGIGCSHCVWSMTPDPVKHLAVSLLNQSDLSRRGPVYQDRFLFSFRNGSSAGAVWLSLQLHPEACPELLDSTLTVAAHLLPSCFRGCPATPSAATVKWRRSNRHLCISTALISGAYLIFAASRAVPSLNTIPLIAEN